MKKTSKLLLKLAYALIFIVFAKLYVDILYQFLSHQAVLSTVERLLFYILTLVVLAGTYILLVKFKEKIKKFDWVILCVVVVFIFTVQIIMGNELRITPVNDLEAVYDGAIEWLVEGSFYNYYEYYYYWPNNLGELSFLTFFFGIAAKMGFHDFYFVGILLNALLSAIMIISTFVICKKIFSSAEAVFSLILYALCPPFYLMAAVFYTDQLTMAFPVFIIMLFLFYEKNEYGYGKNALIAFLISLTAFAGYYLKPTVFIVMIAVYITLLLKGTWKKLLLLLANTIIVFICLTLFTNGYFYSHHLDKKIAEKLNTPIEAWVYMGLNEQYGYSFADTAFSRGIEDPQERKMVLREKIVERVEDYGIVGMYNHLREKGVTTFSDGTFELSYTFISGFVKDTPWEDIVTQPGSKYGMFWKACSYHWYTILLFGVIFYGIVCAKLFRKKADDEEQQRMYQLFPMALSLLGLFLFLIIWEAHYRYICNHYGFFLIMAVSGMYYLFGHRFIDKTV